MTKEDDDVENQVSSNYMTKEDEYVEPVFDF
jgi:hypothetical protein